MGKNQASNDPSRQPEPKPSSKSERAKSDVKPWIQTIVATYGDLIFDLCQGVLWSPTQAPVAFKAIIRTLKRYEKKPLYKKYERPWILQVACQQLRKSASKTPRRLTPAEQVMLDSNPDPKARLRQFDSYFHRLPLESQILLILRDKYGIPMPEIAAILEAPEASVKLRRQQALRSLEDWIWSGVDAVL